MNDNHEDEMTELRRRLAIEDRVLRLLVATFDSVRPPLPPGTAVAMVTARAITAVLPPAPCCPGAEMFFDCTQDPAC